MDRLLLRTLAAFALAMVSILLIWGGHMVWQEGRSVSSLDFRFAHEYFLGSQLLWMLSGAVGAGVIAISSRPRERSVSVLLAAAAVPVLVALPMYVWLNPNAPSWLIQVTPISEWLISPHVQVAAPVLAGAFLGSALWRPVISAKTTTSE
jgi:cell division protein FtsW (lipid II flippase)